MSGVGKQKLDINVIRQKYCMRLEYVYNHTFSEGLDAKIPELVKQFQGMPPEEAEKIIRSIAEADPTEQKVYTPWLIKQVRKNNLRLPEDKERALASLRLFDQNKRVATFPGPKDINAYKIFQDLESVTDKLQGQELTSKRQTKRQVKEEGAKLVYDDSGYTVIEIIKPEAAVVYSKGSKWCTSNVGTAGGYLKKGPIHIIFKYDEKIAQLHAASQQLMDLTDRPYDYTSDPGLRSVLGQIIKPTSPESAFFLARIAGKRIPEAEAEIAKNASLATQYAIDVIKGRWPEAEEAIAKDPRFSVQYARDVIKGRWPEAEKWMGVRDIHSAIEYAAKVLKKRWPTLEEALLQQTDQYRTQPGYSVSSSTSNIMSYISRVIQGRWPEAEQIIAKDGPSMLKYAELYIRGPWPEVEQTILRSNSETIFAYITRVLKGPWPRFERAVLKAIGKLTPATSEWRDVARIGFKYSRDVKNGSWPEFETLLSADPDFEELYKHNIGLRKQQ